MTHIRETLIHISQVLQNIVSHKFKITEMDITDTERNHVNSPITKQLGKL